MRHFSFPALAPPYLAGGMTHGPLEALLVQGAGAVQTLASAHMSAMPGAVDVSVVTLTADAHLLVAASTVE
jgi:hypothetical protein